MGVIAPASPWARTWRWVTSWAPWACTIIAMFAVVGLLFRPETILFVPLRLVSLVQLYFSFVLERIISRAELELASALFGGSSQPVMLSALPASSEPGTPSQPMHYIQQQPPSLFNGNLSLFGWCAAILAVLRKL